MSQVQQYQPAVTLTGPELVPVLQNGITVRATVQQIANLGTGGGGGGGSGTTYTAGSGLALTGTTFSLATVPLANLAQGAASNGQALTWNGTQWTPTSLAAGTSYTGVAPVSINGAGAISLAQGGATTGQGLVWNGTAWAPGNVTPTLPSIANNAVLANISGSSATPTATGVSALLDSVFGTVQGSVFYRGASVWAELTPGTSGYVLQTNGAGSNPTWVASSGGGSSGFGTPTTVTASGAVTISLSTTKTFYKLSNTSGVTTLTLPNGTTDGQEFLLEVLPTTQAHTLAGTIYEASETIACSSPNEGYSFNAIWNTALTSWVPRNRDGGYKIGDLSAASSVAGTDLFGVSQSGADRNATALQVSAYSLGRISGDLTVNTGTGVATVARLTPVRVSVSDSSGTATCSLANNQRVFDIGLTSTGRTVAVSGTPVDGDVIVLRLKQDATGSRTVTTWPTSFKWGGGSAPTLSTAASARDTVSAMWDATNSVWDAVFKGGFA